MTSIRCPSRAMLKKHFKLGVLQADKLRDLCHSGWPRAAMNHANIYLGGYGVESLDPEAPHIQYVNMGDTYSNTILYNSKTHYMWIGSWGDWVEKNVRYK